MKTDRWGLPSPRPLPPATSMSRSGNRSCPRSAISASCRPWPLGVVAFIMSEDHAAVREDLQGLQHQAAGHHPRADRGVSVGRSSGRCWALPGCSAMGLLVYGVLRYAGSIRWDLPGMDWLLRRRHVATVLDALALAAQRQRPLGEALSTLAASYPQRSIARRLRAVCDDLQAGGDDLAMPASPRFARQDGPGPAASGPAKRQPRLGRAGNGRQQPPPLHLPRLCPAASDLPAGHRRLWAVDGRDRGRFVPPLGRSHTEAASAS